MVQIDVRRAVEAVVDGFGRGRGKEIANVCEAIEKNVSAIPVKITPTVILVAWAEFATY